MTQGSIRTVAPSGQRCDAAQRRHQRRPDGQRTRIEKWKVGQDVLLFVTITDIHTSEQLAFVAKGLETLPDDGRAVVMQHYCIAESIGRWMRPGQPLTHAKRVRGFGGEALHAIFAAFVHSEAGTRDVVSWNFTGKPQRRLAACFCGDSHFDSHGVLDDVNYVISQGYGPCHPLLLAPGTTFVWKSDRTKNPMIDVLGVKRIYENIGLARVFRVGDGGAAHDREWCF